MTDLITRIEQVDGPSRELFLLAWNAKAGRCCATQYDVVTGITISLPTHEGAPGIDRFLAMLDAEAWTSAAEMLVPEGWTGIIPVSPNQEAWLWPEGGTMHRGHRISAAHPSLALLAAILRAERNEP